MKPHPIADGLLLKTAKHIVRVMIGEEYVNKLNDMYISLDTVDRRIANTSADILDRMIEEMKSSILPIFSIKLYESTYVENGSQLLTSQEEFIELINSDVAQTDFSSISIAQFWIKCLKSCSVISYPFLRLLLPFSTYISLRNCVSGLVFIKSKYSIRLDEEDDVSCASDKTMPRIQDLVKQQQDQSSQ
ncbi:hypothetical protein RF11_15068 [Thelohanellus kitauei]|uniref:HAT C-terminal dimerisation domain-containing protein n=1 Tax=Thelohanellus kitauei TaxID=669202 RepID=A0A0C2ITN4_THEKT|nr:hypothetical protein RF11_15068 [Thelohanellus kitauei]